MTKKQLPFIADFLFTHGKGFLIILHIYYEKYLGILLKKVFGYLFVPSKWCLEIERIIIYFDKVMNKK